MYQMQVGKQYAPMYARQRLARAGAQPGGRVYGSFVPARSRRPAHVPLLALAVALLGAALLASRAPASPVAYGATPAAVAARTPTAVPVPTAGPQQAESVSTGGATGIVRRGPVPTLAPTPAPARRPMGLAAGQ